jgi:hypothetical protein
MIGEKCIISNKIIYARAVESYSEKKFCSGKL